MEKKIRIMQPEVLNYEVTVKVPVMEQTVIPRDLLVKNTAEKMAFDLAEHANLDTDKKDYSRIAVTLKWAETAGGSINGIMLYNNAGDKHLQIMVQFACIDQLAQFSQGLKINC